MGHSLKRKAQISGSHPRG